MVVGVALVREVAGNMALPIYKDPNTNLMLLQTNWTSQLNPVLANPLTNASILKNVALVTGVNVINTKLGQTLQGWFISDINAAVSVFRSAPLSNLTLTLTSSGPAVASIVVF